MPTPRTLPVLLVLLAAAPAAAAETFALAEEVDGRSFRVAVDVTAEGDFEFQPPQQQSEPVRHPVTLKGTYRYLERRLPPAGRDEKALRSLRVYQWAGSAITVGGQTSTPALRESRRKVVASATRRGVTAYSPDAAMTANELELLPYPGDSLLTAALLPPTPVEVGQAWSPSDWVAGALAGVDAAVESKLTCRLEAVKDGAATVKFDGSVDGAVRGASAQTAIEGTLVYDLAASVVTAIDVTQKERRSIGPLAPGMTLTLKTVLRREPATGVTIPDAMATAVPLDPPADALRLEYQAPWGGTLLYDRDWQLFHQTGQVLILRLLDGGSLVAQCNLSPVGTGRPEAAVTDKKFQEDIRVSLGERLKELSSAEELRTGGDHMIYRVTALGTAGESARLWRYYLVTAPDGRQAACAVTLEPHNLERLADRDFGLVTGLTLRGPDGPTPAAPAVPAAASGEKTPSR